MMRPNLFADDDDDSTPQKQTLEIDVDYGRRLEHNRKREDLQRLEELKKRGLIDDDEDSEESDDDYEDDPGVDSQFLDVLIKVKKKDPSILNKDVKFFETEDKVSKTEKKKKKKKMYLKDIQAKHLLEDGPDFAEEENNIQTPAGTPATMQAVRDVFEAGDSDGDEDDLLRVKEKEGDDDDVSEGDKELIKKQMEEYFGEEAQLDEGKKFLKDFFAKQMWKEKDGKSIMQAELEQLEEDEDALEKQEEYETNYRHEENAGEIVMGQSRIVEGSVRKKDSSRKAQRKNKEDRMKVAEMERKEELKRLKNVKKKEIKEKMKKVLSVAGFKEGEECPLDAKELDDEFDPEEYDEMMKAVFDDNYYDAEDSGFNSDEDDGEKPDFDKEDELLGLPKDWDVIKGGDGFIATREKALKHMENGSGDDDKEEQVEREEGKRKRKRKTSLVQRANEALMDEFYKLDYEDTIGDLKTRFKYAKVQPNKYELDTAEILVLEDTELNQYVPLKKMAPYVEKDWEVNKHKVREQKLKMKELWQRDGGNKQDEKRSKKRKKSHIEETKPAEKAAEEGEAETSKLSRKAKRRRRQAEKKLPPNRMAAYGKAN